MKTQLAKIILLTVLFLLPIVINAQAIAYYSGTVKNSDNNPIENVIVSANGALPVSTDAEGKFLLSFDELIYDSTSSVSLTNVSVYFTHDDYGTMLRGVSIVPGDSITGAEIVLVKEEVPELYAVSGKAAYENGEPVKVGQIAFFNIDGNSDHVYYAYPSNVDGSYEIALPSGSYYVRSSASYKDYNSYAWAYRYIYYNGADKLEDADILEVTNEGVSNLNFVHKNLSLGTISGKVINAQTLQPMPNVLVDITAIPKTDSTIISTDDEGNYSINVFEGDYRLFALESGYKLTYYNQVYNLFEAASVSVTSDNLNVTGIDFSMVPVESEGTNEISGTIIDEDSGLPIPDVQVYAVPLSDGSAIESVISSSTEQNNGRSLRKTDNNGAYTLKYLKNGRYILLFHKDGYLTCFNGKNYEWEKAPVLTLNGNDKIQIGIALKKLSSFGGEISGTVVNSGSILSGTIISAVNESNEVIASDLSKHDGSFLVPSLEYGKYTLRASRVGFSTAEYSQKIQIDLVSSIVVNDVNISLAVTSVEEKPVPAEYTILQNYPNPFNPETVIGYQLSVFGHVTLKIYNVLGKEVATLVNENKQPGYYEIVFDAGKYNLSSGVYFYSIRAGEFTATKKLILQK